MNFLAKAGTFAGLMATAAVLVASEIVMVKLLCKVGHIR